MAIKPFEIQGTALSIGGVEIQSSQDGKVILPGVSTGTGYKLIGFQTLTGQSPSLPGLNSSDVAIWLYNDFLNYTDDGIIQNPPTEDFGYGWTINDDVLSMFVIEQSTRTFTQQEVNSASANNVRLTTVFSNPPTNTVASIDPDDYVSVPIRPIFEATSISVIGGGGGSLAIGDGNSASVQNVTEILINGTVTEVEPGVVGITVDGVEGLSGNNSFEPTVEGDTKYLLNINNDIELKTYRTGVSPGNFGPGFSLGAGSGADHRSGVIAIGNDDVGYDSKPGGVYIGYQAGFNDEEAPQGEFAIAIGAYAARNFALDNSITLNATGQHLDPDESGLFIKPIREEVYDDVILFYNPQSGEVTYAANNLVSNSLTGNKEVKVTVGNTEYFAIVNRINADGDDGVKSSGVAYDSNGNMIALHVGELYIASTQTNIDRLFISKFDNVGELLWQKQIEEDVDVEADHDLVIDADDNIIIAISKDWPGPDTIIVIKFGSDGTVLWQKEYKGTELVTIIESNIVPTSPTLSQGTFEGNPVDVLAIQNDYAYLSLNTNWQFEESADGNIWTTLGTVVGVSAYLSGSNTTQLYFAPGDIEVTLDYPTKSYRLRTMGINSSLEVTAIALSGTDIVVAAEYVEDTNTPIIEGLLFKISSTGVIQWARTFDIEAPTNPYGMDVGADGNIVVVGAAFPDALPVAAFAQKFDGVTGEAIWTNILFGPYAENSNEYTGGDVVIDSQNNIFITVNSNQPIVHENGNNLNTTVSHVMKLNSAGATQWCRRIGPGPCASVATGIDCDNQGNVYLAALTTVQNNPVRDADEFMNNARNVLAVAKYDTAGAVLWQRYIQSDFYRFYPDDDTTFPGSFDPTTSRGRNMSIGPNGKLAIQVSAQNLDPDGNSENNPYWESITFQIDQDGREMTVGSGNEKFTVKASRIPGRFVTIPEQFGPGGASIDFSANLDVSDADLNFQEAELAQQIVRSASYEYVFGNDGTLTIPNDGDIKLTQTQIGWFSIFGPANNDINDIWIRANCVDATTGDVYVVGQDDDSGRGLVARYNSQGQVEWSIRLFDNVSGNGTRCNAVKVDPDTGNVVVLAEYFGINTGMLLVEIEPDTARVVRSAGFRDLGDNNGVNAYDFDFLSGTGNVVIVGRKYDEYQAIQINAQAGSTTGVLFMSRAAAPTISTNWYVSGTGITGRTTIDNIDRYPGLTSTVRQGSGTVTFDITDNGNGTYSLNNSYGTAGTTNYLVGHKLKVLGSLLGGVDGVNDAILTITAIDPGGVIESISGTIEGTAAGVAPASYTGVAATNYETGSGCVATITFNSDGTVNGVYSFTEPGSNYVVGDVLTFAGTQFPGGASPANDITMTVIDNGAVNGGVNGTIDVAGTIPTTLVRIQTVDQTPNYGQMGSTYSVLQPVGGEAFVAVVGGTTFALQWTKVLSAGGEFDTERYLSVAVDSSNNIYAAGEMVARNNAAGGDLNSYWCAVVSKFSSSGTHQWTRALNNDLNDCYAKSVAVRGNNLVVTYENSMNAQTVVTKLDGTGTVKWQRMTNTGDDSSVAIDTNGDVYIVAEAFMESDYGNCIKVIKFNSAGEIVWRKILATQLIGYNATSEYFKNGRNLTLDTDHLYVSGYTTAYDNNFDNGFLVKIPKSGDQDGVYDIWVIQQDTYDVDQVTSTEATAFTPVVGTGEFELWEPDFETQWWDPSNNNSYYHTRVEIRDRDGGAIEFADGTRQTSSAQQISQIKITNGADHRLCLDDMGKHIYVTNQNTKIAVPYHESVPLPIGFTVVIINNSDSTIAIDADGGGLTIVVPTVQANQYWDLQNPGMATLIKVDENTWFMTGNVVLG